MTARATPTDPNNAQIRGLVEYRAGDGPLLVVPEGPCHVELADDSAVLTWEEEGQSTTTAIPRMDYDRFVQQGSIVPDAG